MNLYRIYNHEVLCNEIYILASSIIQAFDIFQMQVDDKTKKLFEDKMYIEDVKENFYYSSLPTKK